MLSSQYIFELVIIIFPILELSALSLRDLSIYVKVTSSWVVKLRCKQRFSDFPCWNLFQYSMDQAFMNPCLKQPNDLTLTSSDLLSVVELRIG